MNLKFDNLFQIVQSSQVSALDVVFAVALAFGLGLLVAYIYKKTFKGVTYSQSYTTSIVLLAPITAMVMLTIGSNIARAFGLVGALSIIRFRTVIKDTKDIMVIFLSLAAGLAVGTMNYHIAVLGTVMLAGFIFILDRIDYGSFYNNSFLVTFNVPKDKINEGDYREILEKYTASANLINISTSNIVKDTLEITYKVEDLNERERSSITKDLSALKNISNLSIISAKNYIEY